MAKKSGKGHNHHKNDNDHGKHHNDNDHGKHHKNNDNDHGKHNKNNDNDHGKHNSHNKSDDAIVNVLDQPDSDGYIVGTQGDDVLVATAGTQVLAGFGGNDRLVAADGVSMKAGLGVDTFVFNNTFTGTARIMDGNLDVSKETIEIGSKFGFTDADQLLAHATEVDAGVLIDLGQGANILIANTMYRSDESPYSDDRAISIADLQAHADTFFDFI